MGLIEDELQEVRKLCEHLIAGSKLVSCVQTMVRVEIRKTACKQLTACIQFPQKYPTLPLLIELKSKTLSEKLLEKLTSVCEAEAKKYLGKPQVLNILKFINNFIDENPLCCCYSEIIDIKKQLSDSDEFKLKQKTSTVVLSVKEAGYYLKSKVTIPHNYPVESVRLDDVETNLPPLFERHLCGQAVETARQCVQPPIRPKPSDPPFKPLPSLKPVIMFIIKAIKQIPNEKCQLCKEQCLPADPQDAERDETADKHVERLYCSHLFHLQCLITYMKTPPFQGGKKCPTCKQQIYHDKWRVSEKLAEDRWAHQQARERELKEVADFFE